MSTFAYTVIAETESEASLRAYVRWLMNGHINDVIEAGALSGVLTMHEPTDQGLYVSEVRYMFASKEAFEAYERGPAVSLRAEGIALFGPKSEHPVRFRRTLGGVVAVFP